MRLYLDEDSASALLVRLLRNAGHNVQVPAEIGLIGKKDPVHLRHAIGDDRILLTRNHRDFEDLHDLILMARGHRPGILVVRRDNNPKRDLNAAGIVRALGKQLAAGVPIADQFIVLNRWR